MYFSIRIETLSNYSYTIENVVSYSITGEELIVIANISKKTAKMRQVVFNLKDINNYRFFPQLDN